MMTYKLWMVFVFAVLVFVFVVVAELVTDLVIEPQRLSLGSKGWRSGESTSLPPMWPGLESWRRRHVVGWESERFFSVYSVFPLSLKTFSSKFQFDLERTDTFQ